MKFNDLSQYKYEKWKINHKTGMFSGESGEKVSVLLIRPIGFVNTRIAWSEKEMQSDSVVTGPICKSPNGVIGYPTAKGYKDYPNIFDVNTNVFSCSYCSLRDWNANQFQSCQEKSFLVFVRTDGNDNKIYGTLELSRSSITKAAKINIDPLWQCFLKISCDVVSKNGNKYSIPVFRITTQNDTIDSKYIDSCLDHFNHIKSDIEGSALRIVQRSATLMGMKMGS